MRLDASALAVAFAVTLSVTPASGQGACSGGFASEMERLGCLLDKHRTGSASEATKAASDIDRRYLRTKAVLVLDLTGFTSGTRTFGQVEALAGVNGVWSIVKPALAGEGGVVLKAEADTLFAVFPLAADAVDGALDAQAAINEANYQTIRQKGPDALRFCSSIGIGYGDVYVVGTEDAFGLEVSYAYNAGENHAGSNQIFMTDDAKRQFAAGTGDRRKIDLPLSTKVTGLRRWAALEESKGLTRETYTLWEVKPRKPSTCIPR